MTSSFGDEKSRWIVAGVVAITTIAAFLLLFRLSPVAISPSNSVGQATPPANVAPRQVALPLPKPVVRIESTDNDAVLREELTLRDMRPLFLPTAGINAMLPEPRREPGRTFIDNETLNLGLATSAQNVGRDFPSPTTLNGKPTDVAAPADVLGAGVGSINAQGFGRGAPTATAAEPRAGFVEAFAVATGHRVLSERLPDEARPAGDKPWEPMEFLASIDAAGLSAPLLLTSSSRVEEVDAHFRNFLARRFRIGDRLPPGFYRIIVGP